MKACQIVNLKAVWISGLHLGIEKGLVEVIYVLINRCAIDLAIGCNKVATEQFVCSEGRTPSCLDVRLLVNDIKGIIVSG